MKQYILFNIEPFYPCGGLADIHGDFAVLGEAVEAGMELGADLWYVVNRDTWAIEMINRTKDEGVGFAAIPTPYVTDKTPTMPPGEEVALTVSIQAGTQVYTPEG